MGHSFGGVVATLYAQRFPQNINAIILVSAPVSMQQTFRTIIDASRKIYNEKRDQSSLGYLDMLEKMDRGSMEFASYSFMNAMKNGFYTPKNRTPEAAAIYEKSKESPDAGYLSQMTYEAPRGFWKNEHYTTLDLTSDLQGLVSKKIKIFGIYGKDDGLYAPAQVEALSAIIGSKNLVYLENASHNVFIDRQPAFLDIVVADLR